MKVTQFIFNSYYPKYLSFHNRSQSRSGGGDTKNLIDKCPQKFQSCVLYRFCRLVNSAIGPCRGIDGIMEGSLNASQIRLSLIRSRRLSGPAITSRSKYYVERSVNYFHLISLKHKGVHHCEMMGEMEDFVNKCCNNLSHSLCHKGLRGKQQRKWRKVQIKS